ncbi:hypothetical protein GF312_05450 [Candidatus Poribacteria bacterium]|nr:hypothetical protein [Candidatus Poribacteria bacterium]
MKKIFFIALAVVFCLSGTVFAALDDFDGTDLSGIWTLRDPADKADISFDNSELVLDLAAGADMYIRGTDAGVLLLTEPPAMEDFTLEMKVNAAVDGEQPPACHIGPVFFNEDAWAYSAWGPYSAGQDIRLEDCVDASYRWRDQIGIGIDPADIAVDGDLWLRIVRTGDDLEFFAKGNAGDDWMSAGVESTLTEYYTEGDYMVGIIAKSWGGSVDSTFRIDYFDIPELTTTAVSASGKLATTWSAIK